MKKKLILFLFFSLLVSGCTQGIYNWHGYDDAMYNYYKTPVEKEKFIEKLTAIITLGERTNNVPPGIYAEYGYLQYESGNFAEAIKYFQKEHDRWPESRTFISKMIRNAQLALEREKAVKAEKVNDTDSIESKTLKENL